MFILHPVSRGSWNNDMIFDWCKCEYPKIKASLHVTIKRVQIDFAYCGKAFS